VLGVSAMAAAALSLDPLLTLGAAGAMGGLAHLRAGSRNRNLVAVAFAGGGLIAGAFPFSLTVLFLMMLKIGATMFGGGYILVAFLQSDFVTRLGWLSERQLLDTVAVGQATTRSSLHDRNLRWVRSRRDGGCSACHDSHLPSRIRPGRPEWALGTPASQFRTCRSRAGRHQCPHWL
jgi:hypothetical protein